MNKVLIKYLSNDREILRNVKMMVFDMAGTVVNEKGVVYKTLYKTLKDFNINVSEDEIRKNWSGVNKYEVLNYFLERENKNNAFLSQELNYKFEENLLYEYDKPGSIELVSKEIPSIFNNLQNNGVKIALNTGYNRDIQNYIVKKLDMKLFTDDHISSDQVKRGRPYPYMIHKLMERNDIQDVKSVVKIGDSKNDILEGRNAGCLVNIGVLSGAGNRKTLSLADYIVNDITDISVQDQYKLNL